MNPQTQTLHEKLEAIIAATPAGERLPSEPKLARQLGVSRATLREAMRVFETRGMLRRKQGAGTFVLKNAPVLETGIEILESIETQARRMGLPVSLGDLRIIHRAPSLEEQEALRLEEYSQVVEVRRVILLEDRPVAYLVDILPDAVLAEEELRDEFSGSVLDVLLTRGNPPLGSSRCDILAEAASPEVARPLGIQRGDVLLKFVSVLLTESGEPIDFSQSYFLPGYFRFHVVRRVG